MGLDKKSVLVGIVIGICIWLVVVAITKLLFPLLVLAIVVGAIWFFVLREKEADGEPPA